MLLRKARVASSVMGAGAEAGEPSRARERVEVLEPGALALRSRRPEGSWPPAVPPAHMPERAERLEPADRPVAQAERRAARAVARPGGRVLSAAPAEPQAALVARRVERMEVPTLGHPTAVRAARTAGTTTAVRA